MTTRPSDSPHDDAPTGGLQLSNLSQRLLTSVILLPIVIGATAVGGWAFALTVGIVGLMGLMEFFAIARQWAKRHTSNTISIGIALIVGIVYIAIPSLLLIMLREQQNGLVRVLLVYALTWGTDTFAYFGGRLWGKTPLAPQISPKKTREGAVVGVIGAFVSALLLLIVTDMFSPVWLILLVLGPIAAIAGDLVESAFKRAAAVKDSHLLGFNIFPGHGGVLDRIDSLVFVTTLTYVFIQLVQTGVAV